jgi:spore maturation protein CgeB
MSFAAITSMPTEVMAAYLREFHRVLKPTGVARLQIYLGNESAVEQNDTLQLRCYNQEKFADAARAAGLELEWRRDLVLPFKVSFEDLGIAACVVSLKRTYSMPAAVEAIAALMSPTTEAEGEASSVISSADLEVWMSLNYAKELAEQGDIERARAALEYAESFQRNASIDVRDLLERIITLIDSKQLTTTEQSFSEENRKVLHVRFPYVQEELDKVSATSLRTEFSADGAVIFEKDQCLDHAEKPKASAEAWAKRLLQEGRVRDAQELVIFGFGTGYHIEALGRMTDKALSVIEPNPAVIARALEVRDLRGCFQRLKAVSVGLECSAGVFGEEAELCLRPQTQSLYPEFFQKVKAAFYGVRGLTSLHPTVAVLGPLQGGSLPIMGYTLRSLQSLKQRVREWDVSGFTPSFHAIEKFFFDKTRIQGVQNIYLETVSQVLLEAVNEKNIDVLICMAQAPVSGRVLTELRNRGVTTVLWFMEDYLRFGYWKELARYYDFVFTIQRGRCMELIKQAGAGEVHYLPMACDPGIHRPVALTSSEREKWGSPISFVGAGYHNRQQVFASFADMPFKIWGTEWPECKPFDRLVQDNGRRLTPVEYNKIFNATGININLHSSSERDGVDPTGDFVNPRTFELAAAGGFQLVDERSLLAECFEAEREVVTFRNPRELKEKIAYYTDRPAERQAIADRARARALRDHTYDQRIRQMLSIIYSSKFEHLRRREENGGWCKMLKRAEGQPELSARCKAAFDRGEEPVLDGLVADIITGKGKLTETEQKLLFLYHVRKQIIRMRAEETGQNR